MAGGRKDWRPGDSDRARYATVLEAARAEGRIDDAELSRRSFTIRYAQTMGELDAVVHDLPAPPSTARRRSPAVLVVAGAAVVAAVVAGFVFARGSDDDGDNATSSDVDVFAPAPAPVVDGDEAATVEMYSLTELAGMWDALGGAQVPGIKSVYIHDTWADLEVQADSEVPQYDKVSYDGALGPFEPSGQVSGEDLALEFFPLDEVDPAVIAAAAARASEVAGYPDRAVSIIIVQRDVFFGGIVTIRVNLEADAYGDSPTLTWDASGQHLLDDGSEP